MNFSFFAFSFKLSLLYAFYTTSAEKKRLLMCNSSTLTTANMKILMHTKSEQRDDNAFTQKRSNKNIVEFIYSDDIANLPLPSSHHVVVVESAARCWWAQWWCIHIMNKTSTVSDKRRVLLIAHGSVNCERNKVLRKLSIILLKSFRILNHHCIVVVVVAFSAQQLEVCSALIHTYYSE